MPRNKTLSANPYVRLHRELRDHPDWLPVITEGDSWFSFPGILLRMNVVSHLQYTFKARMAFLRFSYHGDELHDILTGRQLQKLKRALRHKVRFKILLFSGGGNDLIQSFSGFVKKKADCDHWRDCIREKNLQAKLDEIEQLYCKLVRIRNKLNRRCRIYVHSYDYSSVNGKPVKFGSIVLSGAWLEPVFLRKGITSKRDQRAMVKYVMDRFYEVLKKVEKKSGKRFVVIDTRGTLSPSDWGDEIHPSHEGFGRIAKKIAARVAKDYPRYFSRNAIRKYR